MRLVFAGTPEFALPALDALVAAGHDLCAVYTQPDRPAGRGRKLHASAVGVRAAELKLPLFKPEKFTADAIAGLRALAPEVVVVAAYGLILPQAVLDIPARGCFNIHASLLPRWRGAAPVQRAILAGDAQTGVCIMRMDAGLDTGAVLLRESIPIGAQQTAGELQAELAQLGARLMVEALDRLDTLQATPQPATGATYAKKITKDEARLDWSRPAAELARAIRAFHPAPVAWSEMDGERVLIHRAGAARGSAGASPGTVMAVEGSGVTVATGDGALRVTELQRAGGKVLPAAVVARAWIGRRFT